MTLWRLETYGDKLSFLRAGKIHAGYMNWSNMKLISKTNNNIMSAKTKANFVAANVDPGKLIT